MNEDGKPLVFSSQVGINFLVSLVAVFVPGVSDLIVAHPELAMNAFGLLNVLWRVFITKTPITSVF